MLVDDISQSVVGPPLFERVLCCGCPAARVVRGGVVVFTCGVCGSRLSVGGSVELSWLEDRLEPYPGPSR